MLKSLIVSALILSTGLAIGAEATKEARPVACLRFNVFTDPQGVTMAVCAPTTAKGKAAVLRTFSRAKVVDPTTDKTVEVLVGFR